MKEDGEGEVGEGRERCFGTGWGLGQGCGQEWWAGGVKPD